MFTYKHEIIQQQNLSSRPDIKISALHLDLLTLSFDLDLEVGPKLEINIFYLGDLDL